MYVCIHTYAYNTRICRNLQIYCSNVAETVYRYEYISINVTATFQDIVKIMCFYVICIYRVIGEETTIFEERSGYQNKQT